MLELAGASSATPATVNSAPPTRSCLPSGLSAPKYFPAAERLTTTEFASSSAVPRSPSISVKENISKKDGSLNSASSFRCRSSPTRTSSVLSINRTVRSTAGYSRFRAAASGMGVLAEVNVFSSKPTSAEITRYNRPDFS